ncbi:MAG TPA: NACHT domain-containing protein [archaeon]|nr:NACHT domain-containing protein [archaeon]
MQGDELSRKPQVKSKETGGDIGRGLTPQDLELLGYTFVDADENFSKEVCTVLKGTVTAGIKTMSASFLYFKTKVTKPEASKICQYFKERPEDLYVLAPDSIIGRIRLICREHGIPFFAYEDLLWKKTSTLLGEYVVSLKEDIITEENYVKPRRAGDPHSDLEKELVSFLSGHGDNAGGRVVALSASAGVGKTTLARHIVKSLAFEQAKRTIPVFLESRHWSRLQLEGIDGLWDVISDSLRNLNPELRMTWEIFEYMLRCGFICFVFDGFDELCGDREFPLRPNEILTDLSVLAKESDARILLTTRTIYWQNEITSTLPNVEVIELASFNTQQAKRYFDTFFSNQADKDRALGLYTALIKRIQPPTTDGSQSNKLKFINLPVSVAMIAQCVRRMTSPADYPFSFEKGAIHALLSQLCEREKERQKLSVSADDQLLAFRELAMLRPEQSSPMFEEELLETIGLNANDVRKMASHPLLCRKDPAATQFGFAYDFLPHYFRAMRIVEHLQEPTRPLSRQTISVMIQQSNGKGFLFDYILDACTSDYAKNIAKLFEAHDDKMGYTRSFLFHLAREFAKRDVEGKPKSVHTDETFQNLLGKGFLDERRIENIVFLGNIEGLDLSGLEFIKCRFTNCTFIDCSVDPNTKFTGCSFHGDLEFVKCAEKDWKEIQGMNTSLLCSPTNLAWQSFAGKIVGLREEHIKDALQLACNKFFKCGRLRRSIRRQNWYTGSLGHSIYCEPLLKEMLHQGVIKQIRISGVHEGGYILDPSCLGDLQQFMDSRQLIGKLRKIYEAILDGGQ